MMDVDKQIKEMAKAIEQARIKATNTTNSMNYGFGGWYAKELYNAGYRKIKTTDWLTKGISAEQLEQKKKEALDEFAKRNDYVKASDVAREIFEEIDGILNIQAKIVCQTRDSYSETDEPNLSFIAMLDGRIYSLRVVEEQLDELKKKYAEGEE